MISTTHRFTLKNIHLRFSLHIQKFHFILTRTCSHLDIEYPKKICEYQMKYYQETKTTAK